ncbi:MAG: hypothetical protein ACYC6A_00645 [Armatimonadota bacterium]
MAFDFSKLPKLTAEEVDGMHSLLEECYRLSDAFLNADDPAEQRENARLLSEFIDQHNSTMWSAIFPRLLYEHVTAESDAAEEPADG